MRDPSEALGGLPKVRVSIARELEQSECARLRGCILKVTEEHVPRSTARAAWLGV